MTPTDRREPKLPATPAASRITVFATTDARFFPGLLVTFYSLLRHLSPAWSADFKLLTDGLDGLRRLTLERVLQAAGRDHTLEIIQPDFTQFAAYPAQNGDNRMVYARLLIPGLAASDRVLYVDSDIVVMKDVSRLAELPWQENHVLHAIGDNRITTVSHPWEHLPSEQLGIPPDTPYFNSGFLWINLAAWRQQNISQACLEYTRRFPDRIVFHDQTILNAVLWRRWTPFDETWNLPSEGSLGYFALYPLARSIDANVHYLSAGKPWLEMNPFQHFYQAFAAEIAPLLPAELAPRRVLPGETAKRWRYFAQRAYRHYGRSAKRGVRRLLGRQPARTGRPCPPR